MAWDDILGHDLAKRIWQAHLATGRVSSAYLLAGPEGIGKRRLALEMAKALNCLAEALRPCDTCPVCGQINRQTHPDVHVVGPSGASNQIKIEDIRHLIGRLVLRPYSARVQVAILDGVERLTEEAANSLLKVLEEPSVSTRFLLTTSQLSHCLPTIVSRCQVIRCQPLPAAVVRQLLVKAHGVDPQLAETIARAAQGSAARAIELAERWNAYESLFARCADTSPERWLTQPLPETRDEVTQLLEGMMGWLRDLAVAATGDPTWVTHTARAGVLQRQARAVDVDHCVRTAFEVVELRESLEQFVSPRLVAALAREKWLSLHLADV